MIECCLGDFLGTLISIIYALASHSLCESGYIPTPSATQGLVWILSAIKAWVTVEWIVFTDNFNVVYFSISTSYELLCTNRKFHVHPPL